MTSRERFLHSLKGGTVDRFYRYEHGPWPTTRERWVAEGYPADADFNRFFHMDPLARFAINSGYTDSPYQPPFPEETLERTAEYVIRRDRDGIEKKELLSHADTSMPQFLRYPVRDRQDWATVRSRLDPADAAARIGDRACLPAAPPDVPTLLPICGAFGHPRNLLGDEALAYLLYDDPALFEEILDNWLDLYIALLRALAPLARVDVLLIWEDMCYRNGPLISPAHVAQFMIPRYRSLIETARACGVEAVLVDTDGDCRVLIPLFLDAGVDALMPFEVQAGMDVVEIARRYPGLGIMGGIDKRALAANRDAIRREVDRVVPFFLERGGFLPTLDHTVPPNVPLDHFRWYLDCLRRYES